MMSYESKGRKITDLDVINREESRITLKYCVDEPEL